MRRSGILLHPTSLPGRFGIGDLGPWAYRFADFLAASDQTLWQMLPLGPPARGNSPYQCYSSMAGNPLLISPECLVDAGLLRLEDVEPVPPGSSPQAVDFDSIIPWKWGVLRVAAANFFRGAGGGLHRDFERFCDEEAGWLDQFARFTALKEMNRGTLWTEWARRSDPDPEEVRIRKFTQFEFFREWKRLKRYCNERRIWIIGDLPVFVAHDSADVWGNPEMFDLDDAGNPREVAGVPPDYFSSTGQLWGNPLYRWEVLKQAGFAWWVERMKVLFVTVDIVRLDHFRGFEKYWAIPAGAKTAEQGVWREGPGDSLFQALQHSLGKLPIIAEDLGVITPAVHALRDRWGFPGMRVLQFAFANEDPTDPFKPHNYPRNCVVYTGTHDNNTTVGWFNDDVSGDHTLSPERVREERRLALRYLNSDGREIHWDFIRAVMASVADTAIFPMQDVLGLGSEARMNVPARPHNNWRWRMEEHKLEHRAAERLRELARLYDR